MLCPRAGCPPERETSNWIGEHTDYNVSISVPAETLYAPHHRPSRGITINKIATASSRRIPDKVAEDPDAYPGP